MKTASGFRCSNPDSQPKTLHPGPCALPSNSTKPPSARSRVKLTRAAASAGRSHSVTCTSPGSRRSPKPNSPSKRRSRAAMLRKQSKLRMRPRAPVLCFAQYFEHWLKEHASRRCAPKTLERYGDIGAYLIRELGGVRLNEMTTGQIQEAIHHLQDHGGRRTETEPRGRPLAPKTVRHMGTLLHTVLSDADRLGVLKIPNPMANRRVLLPKLTKRRPAVLDATKLQALFDRAQNTRLYPLVVLAAATGCRRGELLALEWSDLDEAASEINVSKSLEQTKAGLRIKTTKSEEARRFSVPEWALEVLRAHRQEQQHDRQMFGKDYDEHNLVFCQPGGAYYSPDRLGARVVELMRKVGLEGVSLHSLRHSHATILLSNGVPVAVVSERLGHADQNITLSIYSHALPADTRAAAKIWNDSMADVIADARRKRFSAGVARPARRTGTA